MSTDAPGLPALPRDTGQLPSVTVRALDRCQKKTDNGTSKLGFFGGFFVCLFVFICKLSPLKETRLVHVKTNNNNKKGTEIQKKGHTERQAIKIMGFLKKNASVKCYARQKWLVDTFKQV